MCALLDKKVVAAETVRPNRCEKCPLKTEKDLKEEMRGSSDRTMSKNEKLLRRWRDNKTVNLASNFIAVEDEDTAHRCSNINKCFVEVKHPAIVKAYNCSMRGVDKIDFIVALNRTTIQSRK